MLLSYSANSQTKILDSLERQFKMLPSDSTASALFSGKALYYHGQEKMDSFQLFMHRLKQYAESHDYPAGLADLYHLSVYQHVMQTQYDTAILYARTELKWALKSDHPKKIAYAYNSIGNTFIYLGNGDSSAINLLRGLPYAWRSGDKRLPVNMLFNLSAAYNILENYALARDHAKKAYLEAEKIADSPYMKSSLSNWAAMEAKSGNPDTAIIMYNQLAKVARAEKNDFLLMDIFNNVGDLLFEKKEYAKSLDQYNKMAAVLEKIEDPEYQFLLYANRGNTLTALNRFSEAEKDLIKATALAENHADNFRLKVVYGFRSSLAEKMHDYKTAFSYWKAADSLKQLIANDESKKRLEQLEVRYQTAQKDLSISQQQLQLANKENAIKKKNIQNMALLGGCALLLIIIALAYKNIRHRHRLAQREREIHDQQINELEKKHQLDAMLSMLRVQEEERSRLAKDLHDGIGGLLSGVKLGLSSVQSNRFLSDENTQRVDAVIDQLDRSIQELRRVSHNMMPEALIRFGLKEALENYCENINLSGKLKVRLQTYGIQSRMEQSNEISIYRIVQELLNNIIKHADASNVLIQLTHEDNKFSLTVEDDGKGFDLESVNAGNHAGLANIRSRASLMDGSVDISTAPGQGTSVTIIGKC